MRPDEADRAYLQDMVGACDKLGRFVAGKSFDAFARDEVLQSAVERQVEIIGEAARHLSDGFRSAHPHVPWRPIIAQRHILAHEYGDVEHELVWRVATVHVPALARQLHAIVAALDAQ